MCIGVPIARTGEMVYGEGETPLETDDEGKILIHREEEEVFRPETIASFEGKAVTITHPIDFVSPENWSRLAKGVLQNVRRGDGENKNDLIADLLITDHIAINLVKNGLREVSCGYEAEYTQTGEGRGLQTKIIGNHLALVDQGRAGSAYAINDHKGKVTMKLKDKIKAIFAKAQDEAMSLAGDAEMEEKKEKESKDAEADKDKDDDKKSKDAAAYDELVKIVKDLSAKVSALGQPKDDAGNPAAGEKEEVAKDEEVATSLEDRLKALEASVAKLLEMEAKEQAGEEGEMFEDEEGVEADLAMDDDFEESTMTGDTASRVEILAPGLKASAKDVKAQALKTAYATKDGKAVIDQLTGGKAPELKDDAKVNTLFIAASELLKVSRNGELSRTKQTRATDSAGGASKGALTAEEMNAINAKHYGKQN